MTRDEQVTKAVIEACAKVCDAENTQRIAWLIERNQRHGQTTAKWFRSRERYAQGNKDWWTENADKAEQYPTKEAAQRRLSVLFDADSDPYKEGAMPDITEHVFISEDATAIKLAARIRSTPLASLVAAILKTGEIK